MLILILLVSFSVAQDDSGDQTLDELAAKVDELAAEIEILIDDIADDNDLPHLSDMAPDTCDGQAMHDTADESEPEPGALPDVAKIATPATEY